MTSRVDIEMNTRRSANNAVSAGEDGPLLKTIVAQGGSSKQTQTKLLEYMIFWVSITLTHVLSRVIFDILEWSPPREDRPLLFLDNYVAGMYILSAMYLFPWNNFSLGPTAVLGKGDEINTSLSYVGKVIFFLSAILGSLGYEFISTLKEFSEPIAVGDEGGSDSVTSFLVPVIGLSIVYVYKLLMVRARDAQLWGTFLRVSAAQFGLLIIVFTINFVENDTFVLNHWYIAVIFSVFSTFSMNDYLDYIIYGALIGIAVHGFVQGELNLHSSIPVYENSTRSWDNPFYNVSDPSGNSRPSDGGSAQ